MKSFFVEIKDRFIDCGLEEDSIEKDFLNKS